MANKKPNLGRQKIVIQKISKRSNLQVTFSKRCAGIFKKASELCTLCGIDIAVIVFSPGNKAFSFGHPNVEPITERFLAQNLLPNFRGNPWIEARQNANVHELNMQLTQILNQLEAEKNQGEALNEWMQANPVQSRWRAPINEMNLHELEQLKNAMEDLKKNVYKLAE